MTIRLPARAEQQTIIDTFEIHNKIAELAEKAEGIKTQIQINDEATNALHIQSKEDRESMRKDLDHTPIFVELDAIYTDLDEQAIAIDKLTENVLDIDVKIDKLQNKADKDDVCVLINKINCMTEDQSETNAMLYEKLNTTIENTNKELKRIDSKELTEDEIQNKIISRIPKTNLKPIIVSISVISVLLVVDLLLHII
jgi:hypothetical protein